jgi:hypothetical protein
MASAAWIGRGDRVLSLMVVWDGGEWQSVRGARDSAEDVSAQTIGDRVGGDPALHPCRPRLDSVGDLGYNIRMPGCP